MISLGRTVALILVVGAVVAIAAGFRLWQTGTELADELTSARTTLTEVDGLEDLAPATADAQADLARAEELSDRLVWRVARQVPLASSSVRTVDGVLQMATAMVALGADTVPLIESARNDLGTPGGGVDADAVLRLRDEVQALELEPVREAVRRVQEQSQSAVPQRIREGREQALAAGTELLETAERAQAGATVAVELLGSEGPRDHLLAIQNPAELRGTGGLIGQVGVLSADAGQIELSAVRSYTELIEDPPEPEAIGAPADFEARYGHVEASTFFGNVNVDPDLPTVAPVMLSLYEAQTGQQLDSVIMVDPLALESLLAVTGPVEVEEDVAGELPSVIEAEEVAEVAMVDAYVALGGADERRERFLTLLAGRVFEALTALDPSDPEVLEAVGSAAAHRHLQVASTDEETQSALELLGAAGRMPRADETDLVAVTANNAGANKQDVHVSHALSVDLFLGEPRLLEDGSVTASRRTDYEFVLDNPLEEGDLVPYIVGSAPAGAGHTQGQVGPEALNRTWLSIWEGEESELTRARSSTDSDRFATSVIDGRRAYDHHLETQGPGREQVEMSTRGWSRLEQTDAGLRYELTVWRQPKGIADELFLRVEVPSGWRISDAHIETAEDGPTLATEGEILGMTDPPELLTGDDILTLRGVMTADVHLVVDLER